MPQESAMVRQVRNYIRDAKKGGADAETNLRRLARTSTNPQLRTLAQQGLDQLEQARANAKAKKENPKNTPRQRGGRNRTGKKE